MTRPGWLRRLRFVLLLALKLAALAFVGAMVLVQIPELRYRLGPREPVVISEAGDLSREKFPRAAFVVVRGKPDYEKAFVYRRYGLSYTYFNLEPYGMRLVIRTHRTVNQEWRQLDRFVGKLRPFRHQPFHYRIRDIYRDKFDAAVPADAFFLALDDVPRLSGWQVGAVAFAALLWIAMFYLFFVFRGWKKSEDDQEEPPGKSP